MELPLAQICPQGNQEAPAPAFSTFQPMGLSRKSSQGLSLLPGSRLQALQAEAQPSPRNLGVPTVAGPQVAGAASSPEDSGRAEEVSREGGQALQVKTRAWFQKTQAPWLLQHGAAPAWFHGFITRREAERLLETKPQGCYLVRFSESAVTFVLTYRSRTCCRHFLLAQLGDGRHVVLGEDSVHTRLQDLLRHYTACPLSPYGETLTEPLPRQTPEPSGLSLRTEESDSGDKSQDPLPQYSPIIKKEQSAASTHKGAAGKPKEPSPPPRPKPPVRAKPQLPPEVYTRPARRPRPTPPPKPAHPIYQELEEPIAFYAMGRGSPGDAPSNIYAEVEAEELAGGEGPPAILGHQVLRKCPSRPTPGGQVKAAAGQLDCKDLLKAAAGQLDCKDLLKAPLGRADEVYRLDAWVRVEVRVQVTLDSRRARLPAPWQICQVLTPSTSQQITPLTSQRKQPRQSPPALPLSPQLARVPLS